MHTLSCRKAQLSLLVICFQVFQPLVVFAASSVSSGGTSGNERVLVSLPIPLTRYNLDGDPIFKLSADSQTNVLVLPVQGTVNRDSERVGKLFINGIFKGDFKGVSVADFTESNGNLVYRTTDGKTEKVQGLPKFKGIDPVQAQKSLQELKDPGYAQKYIDAAREQLKQKGLSDAAIEYSLKDMKKPGYFDEQIKATQQYIEEQSKEQDVTAFVKKYNDSGEGIAGIMQNNQPGSYLVIVSPSFAMAQIMLFKNGAMIAQNKIPLYFYVAQNQKKTKFAYRGQDFGGLDDSGVMVIDDGVAGKKYAWTSQPTYNSNDQVMYMAATAVPKTKDDKTAIACKAVIGTAEKDVQCNDTLFFSLTHQSPYFRFPMASADGQTTVYPELVKAGEYEQNDYENGITTPFESRLVVNGKMGEAHPFLDKPFFTAKGLAVVSYTAKGEQYVEWNGVKSANFQTVNPSLIETLGFRGVSPLYAALSSFSRGDLGVDDIPSDVVVSPDANSIAFAGYKAVEGWSVSRDMKEVGVYQYAHQLSFSPDSKDLAFVAIGGQFEPLLDQSFWLGEGATSQSPGPVSQVMVNGNQIDAHEKILWLTYAPNGVLTYVGRDNATYSLYLNGTKAGGDFDRILMPPRIKDGVVEFVGARQEKVILVRQPLADAKGISFSGSSKPMTDSKVSQTAPAAPKKVITVKRGKLKSLHPRSEKNPTYFTDGKGVYAETTTITDGKGNTTYQMTLLDGEDIKSFKPLSSAYGIGKKVYHGAAILENDPKNFTATGYYGTNGKNVYYLGTRLSADAASFKILNTILAKDKFGVFVNGKTLPDADPETFVAINAQCGADSSHTYCYDQGQEIYKLPPMDGPTLHYMHDGFAYDKNKAVCKESQFDLDTANLRTIQYGYGDELLLDKKRVYKFNYSCPPELVEGMDPNTVQSIMVKGEPSKVWLKDAKHVFYALKIFTDGDPATFRILMDHEFSLDAHHVFWRDQIIADADPKTFTLITDRYAKDSKHVYLWDKILPNIDPKTYKIFGEGPYGVDAKHAFCGDEIIVGADVKSFKPLEYPYAADAQHVYQSCKVVPGADPKTFKVPSSK